jgi:hypothetical protein
MAEPIGIVTITGGSERNAVDTEIRVSTLHDLFEACREAPPSRVVKVVLRSPDGEVHLNFGSFIRK